MTTINDLLAGYCQCRPCWEKTTPVLRHLLHISFPVISEAVQPLHAWQPFKVCQHFWHLFMDPPTVWSCRREDSIDIVDCPTESLARMLLDQTGSPPRV